MSAYEIVLAKEDFKFSVAHFTIFGPHRAERLHGHNYRVRVRASGPHLDEYGLLADIGPLKARIRESCGELDEKTDGRIILCSDYSLAGTDAEARRMAEEIIAIAPRFRLSDYAKTQPYREATALERVLESLQRAGLPD